MKLRWTILLADPTLLRSRQALVALVSAGSAVALATLWEAGRSHDQDPTLVLVAGAIALVTAIGLSAQPWRSAVRTALAAAVGVPAALSLGIVAADAGVGEKAAVLAGVTCITVAVRKVGPAFALSGVAAWVGTLITLSQPRTPNDPTVLVIGGLCAVFVSLGISLVAPRCRPWRLRNRYERFFTVLGLQASTLARELSTAPSRGKRRRAWRLQARITQAALELKRLGQPATPAVRGGASLEARSISARQNRWETALVEAQDAAGFSAERGVASRGFLGEVPSANLSDLQRHAQVRLTVKVTMACMLAFLTGYLVSPAHAWWAVVAAFIAFNGTSALPDTAWKAIDRSVGTALGLGLALLLAQVTSQSLILSVVTIAVALLVAIFIQQSSYAVAAVLITVIFVQVSALASGALPTSVLLIRLVETGVGTVAAIVCTLAIDRKTSRTVAASLYARAVQGITLAREVPDGDRSMAMDQAIVAAITFLRPAARALLFETKRIRALREALHNVQRDAALVRRLPHAPSWPRG